MKHLLNFAILFFVLAVTGQDSLAGENVQKTDIKIGQPGFPLVHIFKDKKGNIIGKMYASENDIGLFASLVIVDENKAILYNIDHNKLIKKSGEIDEEIAAPLMGYFLIVVRDDYVTLNAEFGKNRHIDYSGDSFTIQWNEKEKIFEMQKF